MAKRQRITQERQARAELILDSAEKLFIEKGYADTSVNDIAEHADFSRTSIYQYFKCKEEIYLHILERYTDSLTERSREAAAAVETVPDKIRAFLEVMRQLMKDRPAFFGIFM